MVRVSKYLAIIVLVLSAVSVAVGATFIYQAFEKEAWIKEAMHVEKVTLGIPEAEVKTGNVIDTAEEAQAAADTIREHRRGIAPTYQALLGEGRYDPTNPEHLSYTQALNMENYLYMAVLAFGITTALSGVGAFMILAGLAFAATGVVLLELSKRIE
ncbi:MAG: hypothetical protein JSV54_05945 [Chloroflexota bacterium]|nr:MAG: hypothetical protein JSV54_05945 [Chloroflexota bacterium]